MTDVDFIILVFVFHFQFADNMQYPILIFCDKNWSPDSICNQLQIYRV
jgi:hypothetical protein